jgi:hypothetical protein
MSAPIYSPIQLLKKVTDFDHILNERYDMVAILASVFLTRWNQQ